MSWFDQNAPSVPSGSSGDTWQKPSNYFQQNGRNTGVGGGGFAALPGGAGPAGGPLDYQMHKGGAAGQPSAPMGGGALAGGGAPAGGGLPQLASGMSRDQVTRAITDYYASRGTQPQGNSIQYWTDKYFEFGDKDPEYFNRYLSNAEEFVGGPAGTAKGMWGMDIGGGGGSLAGMGMDPSYGFVQAEGLKGMERSAAARGTLLTGGLQKAMARYAGNLASGEFGNVFNRNLQLANLGQGAASQAGATAANYGNQATNLLTGQGNATAAGTVGGANAWGGTLSQLGQIGANLAGSAMAGRTQTPQPYSSYGPGY